MRYTRYIKEILILVIMILFSITIVDNFRSVKELKISLEQTKENLYQTNQVISAMQKEMYESSFAFSQNGEWTMNNEKISFQGKLNLCNELLKYFQKIDNDSALKNKNKKQIEDFVRGLNNWSKDLRLRQLYYDV